MSKAVLISINPEWCEMIVHGIKNVEVRKTRPKIETPFKCYIYCTLPKRSGEIYLAGNRNPVQGNGKVIGEFICNGITNLKADSATQVAYNARHNTCLTVEQIMQYANGGKLYCWRISNLKDYDKPRAISEFGVKRAPQSWCYVEQEG